ncbi:uncharacterized protein LOC131349354 [Hemibagrus wyckioides]|uniref:uncharacterized protein LOC131349354 n=1 Tax=Hemibagrus wyckioides TaxID=337641 RepID=UPI00266CE304|nr:uncharacterized protein LOC131349354 [Hemibagrus wyckioides]
MDPELDQSISSVLPEMNELSSLEGTSLMEQTSSFLHSDQGGGNAVHPQTKTKGWNQESQEDALLSLDAIFADIEEIINEMISFPALESVPPSPMLSAPSEVKQGPVIPQCVPGLKECKPFEDLLIFSSQPPLDTSEFDHLSHLSFNNLLDSIPDQLLSFQEPSLQEDKNNDRLLETPHPIPEHPVQPHQQSELLDELKPNNLAPASQAAQPQNINIFGSEVTQQTAISPKKEKSLHSQHAFFQLQTDLHEMQLKSAAIPQIYSISSQSPTLGVGQRVITEEQELDLFRRFPLYRPLYAFYPAQHPHQPPFHMPSLQANGPPRVPPFFHPTLSPNLMLPGDQFTYRCQQPSLQPCYMLPNPFIPDRIFNMTNTTFGDCPPQLNCIQPAAVSHLKMNSSPSLLHMNSPVPVNISGRELNLNLHSIPPKLNENFRLWQEYRKVARTVYTSGPDLEALACFFIQAIHSLQVQCPDVPFSAAVRKATLEWEVHSNVDRIKYYHMAQKSVTPKKKTLM